MKQIIYIGLLLSALHQCKKPTYNGEFDCYAEAINIRIKNRNVDTVYIARNFPNFKINNGKFPEEIYYNHNLSKDQSEYNDIIPNAYFWDKLLLNKISIRNKYHFARFEYSYNMHLDISTKFNGTFLTFSPIYMEKNGYKGFFILSEIKNKKTSFTTLFYVCKIGNNYEIFNHFDIYDFMPL